LLRSRTRRMKLIIAGSRGLTGRRGYRLVKEGVRQAIERGWKITEVVSGAARGIDRLGEAWAKFHGIPVKRFPANWDKYGRKTGAIRNKEMVRYADAAIIVW